MVFLLACIDRYSFLLSHNPLKTASLVRPQVLENHRDCLRSKATVSILDTFTPILVIDNTSYSYFEGKGRGGENVIIDFFVTRSQQN